MDEGIPNQSDSITTTNITKPERSTMKLILGAVALIVISVLVRLALFYNSQNSLTTTTVQIAQSLSGGGPGNYYLSQSEMNELFDPGYAYTAQFGTIGINTIVSWQVQYGPTPPLISEIVYEQKSVNAAEYLYSLYVSLFGHANWTTSQINGMSYTYGYTPYLNIFGIKNTTVIQISINTFNSQSLNVTKIASVIAEDIP